MKAVNAVSKDDRLRVLEELRDYIADFRETKPIEPTYLPPEKRQELVEMIREGVGLLKFAYEGTQKLYDDVTRVLERGEELPADCRFILTEFLLKLEGVIHVSMTLVREFGAIWAGLRAHELWEMLEAERKRIRAEMRRRKRQETEDQAAA